MAVRERGNTRAIDGVPRWEHIPVRRVTFRPTAVGHVHLEPPGVTAAGPSARNDGQDGPEPFADVSLPSTIAVGSGWIQTQRGWPRWDLRALVATICSSRSWHSFSNPGQDVHPSRRRR